MAAAAARKRTQVEIRDDEFWIDGKPTYTGRHWRGHKIQGLLLNSRMVQGIFDDANPATVGRWAYPDTHRWDAERNTSEFIAACGEWRRHGLLSFTINLQGGSPQGYSKDQPWDHTAFRADGSLKPEYLARLERILDRADDLGMAPILGFFYFGQDERLSGDDAVRRGVREATKWLLDKGWRNVMVEIANECDNSGYQQPLLRADRIHELIALCRSITASGRSLLVGASSNGGTIPRSTLVRESDFLLLHGNGVADPARIATMVRAARQEPGYTPKPILFNEDDHYDFDRPANNFTAAVGEYASWGFFDYRRTGESFAEGYQNLPADWGIGSERKHAFFRLVSEMAGVDQ